MAFLSVFITMLANVTFTRLFLNNEEIEVVQKFKYLGVYLDPLLSFQAHIDYLNSKISPRLYMLGRSREFMDKSSARMIYEATILPLLYYCDTVFYALNQRESNVLQLLQNKALRIITLRNRWASTDGMHTEVGCLRLDTARTCHVAILMKKCINKSVPPYLQELFQPLHNRHDYITRGSSQNDFVIPLRRSSQGQKSISFVGPNIWNKLPNDIKDMSSNTNVTFRKHVEAWLTAPVLDNP